VTVSKRIKIALAVILFLLLGVLSSYKIPDILAPENRGAKVTEADYFGDSIQSVVYLEQNWEPADSVWFYNTSQGSDLIPYDLFLHLEQAESQQLFRDDENILRFRYLPQEATWGNPDALPVGFVKDSYRGQEYVGFTCAACHTAQINYQGLGMRIDGGPALADMEGFMLALEQALAASLNDEAKLQRLAESITGATDNESLEDVRLELKLAYEKQARYNQINRPTHGDDVVHYGFARLDAFGRIFNRILSHLTPDDRDNRNPPNAPVSYPFLWDTPQHDVVQWNGVSENASTGALGRNVGEVMGVFGSMELHEQTEDKGYRSSVDIRNIIRLEKHLQDLQSPPWPSVFPAIDTALAERGKAVFQEYRCHQCHQPIQRDDQKRLVKAQMASLSAIGTDPQMATNAVSYMGKSGYFENLLVDHDNASGERFPAQSKVLPLLAEAGRGIVTQPDLDKPSLYRGFLRLIDVFVARWHNPVKRGDRLLDFAPNNKPEEYLLAYKGRPLNGIWATAPYLHNGSVPNLYELFLPQCSEAMLANDASPGEDCRSVTFTTGSREYDPIKVGYLKRSKSRYPNLFLFDTRLPGNLNGGHEYAAGKTPVIVLDENSRPMRESDGSYVTEYLPPISRDQRWALVEYLKTL